MVVTRKGFLQLMVSSVGLSALGVAACGDDDGSGGSGGAGTTNSTGGPVTSSSKSSASSTSNTTASTSGTTTSTSAQSSSSTGGMLTCSSMIATNHGHVIEVTTADVEAGADKTYDIMGSSPHTHSVMVTAADFAMLATGGSVTKTSSTGGAHTHMVTITCMA